jgi:electron transfer flavoprotein beta subunit
VPPMLAELLGVPQLTFAKQVEVDGQRVTVHRQTEEGYQVVEGSAPCLVTVTAGIAEPRYASLKGIMAARSKEVKLLKLGDLGIDRGQPAETVESIADADAREAGEIVEDDGSVGVDRIMAVLQSAKVL